MSQMVKEFLSDADRAKATLVDVLMIVSVGAFVIAVGAMYFLR